MRYWDSSAVVPLLVQQQRTELVTRWRADDPIIIVWWGTSIECVSAIARLLRGGSIHRSAAATGFERLHAFAAEWVEMDPSEAIRETASRLLRAHPLRAADALQLAAALRYVDESGETLPFVSFDERLQIAARAERFPIVGTVERGS